VDRRQKILWLLRLPQHRSWQREPTSFCHHYLLDSFQCVAVT
jgi:hypothetical protein